VKKRQGKFLKITRHEQTKNEMSTRLDDAMEIIEMVDEDLKVHMKVEYKNKQVI
jgi:hypothetical protein